ncbi:MAG: tetratricopeptide repeat protein [Terracidiphilus sp.]|jgi:predicted Zn-dependent protease
MQTSASSQAAATGEEPATETAGISAEVAEAEAAIVKSDWKTATAKLAGWLADHPKDARALFDAGYVADAENRLEDAAGFYRQAVMANPKSFEAHLELGLLLARQGKPEDARMELAAATMLDAGAAGAEAKARAWRAMAQIDRKDNPGDASAELLEALKLSPETEADTLQAASLAEQAGQLESAEAAYRRLLAKDAKSAQAHAGLAHILIVRKKYPEAETLLRTALEQLPDDLVLNVQLAAVLAAENNAEALTLLQKLHAAHSDNATIARMLAEVLDEAGETAASDKLCMTLLAATPDDPKLLVSHGQNLLRQSNYSEAFKVFDKATQLDESNADGWSGLAFAASKTNQPKFTVHALTMRSRYLPELPSTYYLWATAYDALQNKEWAITYYHHFLDASAGKMPNQELQAKQRLAVLEGKLPARQRN